MTVFIPLADRPFRLFLSGHKEVELRNEDSPVARQVLKLDDSDSGYACTLSRGYAKTWRLAGTIDEVVQADNLAELDPEIMRLACVNPESALRYVKPNKSILALAISPRQGCGGFPFQAISWTKPLPPFADEVGGKQ